MAAAVPTQARCITRRNVGEAQRALLDYFAGIRTVHEASPAAAGCDALLVQAHPSGVLGAGVGWEEIWRGSRPGDRHEMFVLYRRAARSSSSSIQ
jgi:hypothetical protein